MWILFIAICTDGDSFGEVSAVKYSGSDVSDDAIDAVSCDVSSSTTRAAVVLAAQWSHLTSGQRAAILHRFAQHLQLPVSLLSLVPAENAVEVGWYHRSIYKYLDTGLPSPSLANGDPLKLTSPAQHVSR